MNSTTLTTPTFTSPNAALGNSATGLVVSTQPGCGDLSVADFPSDDAALQAAYDRIASDPTASKTLILDPAGTPFRMKAPLIVWQSATRVTSTGGKCLTPADGYTGALLESHIRPETVEGPDGLITNVVLDHLHCDGENRSLGIRLRHLQLGSFHDLHVCNTDGPGLWISDYCIENLFSNIVLSDECGNEEYPALYIQPENLDFKPEGRDLGNITVNSTCFNGVMIHFPTADALRIGAAGATIGINRRQRKIHFNGCFFHGHGRMKNRPLVTLGDAYEIAIIGCQMVLWGTEGTLIQIGEEGGKFPSGTTMISHCNLVGRPAADAPDGVLKTIGIKLVNPDTGDGAAVLSAFGNNFGSNDARLAHAVDWGQTPGVRASWAANLVNTSEAPFIGMKPEEADVSPFAG